MRIEPRHVVVLALIVVAFLLGLYIGRAFAPRLPAAPVEVRGAQTSAAPSVASGFDTLEGFPKNTAMGRQAFARRTEKALIEANYGDVKIWTMGQDSENLSIMTRKCSSEHIEWLFNLFKDADIGSYGFTAIGCAWPETKQVHGRVITSPPSAD